MRIEKVRAKRDVMDLTAVHTTTDPQSAAIGKLLGFSPEEVRTGLMMVVALLVELGSGLGLWLALEARAPTTRKKNAPLVARKNDRCAVQAFTEQALVRQPDATVAASDLLEAFKDWAGDKAADVTATAFGRRLSSLGFKKDRQRGRTVYLGLAMAA